MPDGWLNFADPRDTGSLGVRTEMRDYESCVGGALLMPSSPGISCLKVKT